MHGRVGRLIAGVAVLATLATVSGVAIASGTSGGFGQDPTGVPPGGGPPYDGSLTTVVSPSTGSVFTGGRLAVILRSRVPARAIQVSLNGHAIGLSASGGGYRASASLGGPLHPGANLITVWTNWGGRYDFDSAQFVIARRVAGLARVQRVLVDGSDAPVTVSGRVAQSATFRASLNGHDASAAFTRNGGQIVGLLGADDGVRYGPNQLVLTADTSTPRSAQETMVSRRFELPRVGPIAGASADRTVLAGQFVSLGAGRSLLPEGGGGKSFSWRVASAPTGSNARVHESTRAKAWFEPDIPGTYRIRLTVSASPQPSAGLGAVRASATRSKDTVTLTAEVNDPYGIPLQSNGLRGAILLNGVALPNTTRNTGQIPGISYAVVDRTTGKSPESGQLPASGTGLNQLLAVAQRNRGRLLVFNWIGALRAHRPLLAEIVKLVGGGALPASDGFASGSHPGSVIGVVSTLSTATPAGTAFFNHRDIPSAPLSANMSGYLRPNGSPGRLDFVFTSFVPVDTAPAAKQTATNSTISVGGAAYSVEHPPGVSGFHVLTLDPKSLTPIANSEFVTNAADGAQLPGAARLANQLQASADDPLRPLVILQSYGEPKGTGDWDRAGLAIQKLGGTRQVFADLNQPWAGGVGGDPTAGRKGGYAFIGRTGGTAPRAEVSYPLDDRPARLAGLLMLTRAADYEPMMVSAVREDGQVPVNEQLVRIANQPPTPWPTLAPGASRDDVRAAENFLGGPRVMKLCPAGATCDVRSRYEQNYAGSWDTILVSLLAAREKCQHEAGVVPQVCEKVRAQLFDEVENTNRVRHYLGPQGLQRPFGTASVAALANLGKISQEILDAVVRRPESATTSNALALVSTLVKVGSVAGPTGAALAGVLSAGFALGAYFTKPDNSASLIGPAIQTTAADLGATLTSRYQTAGQQLDGLGRIIVSDYGKLTAVGGMVDSDPNWIISPGDATAELERAAKRTISETLIPVAYPVLYDLGRVPHLNAAYWRCYYGFRGHRQKFLFDRNPAGAQVVQRFPNDWKPVMAVGAVRATGSQNAARIPTPPATVIDPLFKPADEGGLGMQKLEFYAPSRFRLFPPNPAPPVRGNPRPDTLAYIGNRAPNCDTLPNPPGNSG